MSASAARLRAELRREIHLGTGLYSGEDLFIPLEELQKSSVHVIGASGMGKSRFLLGLMRSFIRYRQPFLLLDPHRELFEFALAALRRSSVPRNKIVLIDPGDLKFSVAFNPLYCGITEPGEASSLVMDSCLAAWGQASFDQTPRLERVLRSTFRLLVENNLTLVEAPDVLNVDNSDLRLALRESVSDEYTRQDLAELEKWPRAEKLAILESSQNRLRRFVQSERVQMMIGQRQNALNLRHVMDSGQYVLANLGSIPAPETQRLLGALLVNAVYHAAKQRDPRHRSEYFIIVDECGQFATADIANALDELRKYGTHFILSHQRLQQIQGDDAEVLSAMLTNAKVRVVFGGLERTEAQRMAGELYTGDVHGDEIKHSVVQTKFRPRLEEYEVESESWSEADTTSQGHGDSLNRNFDEGSTPAGQNETGSRSESRSQSSGVSSGHSASRSTVAVTVHDEFKEETGRSYVSVEDQWEKRVATVHGLGKREALIRNHNGPVFHVRTPDVHIDSDDRAVERFRDQTMRESQYARPTAAVVEEIQTRRKRLKLAVVEREEAGRPFNVKSFRE